MRRHSEIGANILIEVEDYQEVARIVRSHHERFDGAGYPDGLARDEIPLLARVIAVADAYNAMTTIRPYRSAMAPEVAIQQLVNGRGSQFQARAGGRVRARPRARARGLPAGQSSPTSRWSRCSIPS